MPRYVILLLGLFLLPLAAWCAEGELRAPVLGYLLQEDPLELRAISGIPGAAIRGEPLPLPEGVTRLRLAPGHGFALAERGESDPPAVLLLDGGAAPATPVSGALVRAGLVVFSPQGRAAALYSAGEARVQVLTGLPLQPRVSRDIAASGLVGLAVSDDGEMLLTADAQGVVYVSPVAGERQLVFRAEGLAGMTFLPRRREAVVVDGGRGEVFLLGGFDDAVYSRLIASGLEGPGVVRAAADGRSVLVAGCEGNRAWIVDIDSATARALDLPASPAFLEPLRLLDAYLFASLPGEPAWLLVRSPEETRSYFIPGAEGRDPQ
jgi:hypothetical protein